MDSTRYRTPELPWANSKDQKLFRVLLFLFLAATLAIGIIIPNIQLEEVKREKLEKLPPQLAKVIKRKKTAPKPKPKPVAKVVEKKPEPKKPEPKKPDAVKPKPKPQVVVAKPKPKPRIVATKDRSPERVQAAREKAQKMVDSFSDDLEEMQLMVDLVDLDVDSSLLTNAGAANTDVGSVIDQAAVGRISGVDESGLTRKTGADKLVVASRDTTKVKEVVVKKAVVKADAPKLAGVSRSQTDLVRVFERSQSKFDRIYRRALRQNPSLEGTVTLGLTISKAGKVNSCVILSTDLNEPQVEKKMLSTCRRLTFAKSTKVDKIEQPLTFAP